MKGKHKKGIGERKRFMYHVQWVREELSYQTQFCMCECLCVSQTRRLSALSPRERGKMCIIFHPSLTHYSFTYLHSETHKKHIHECWYGLIRALNTRLDVSETHLSQCNLVETLLSASANVCMCVGANVIHQVSGQSSSLSNDWFRIWLTDRSLRFLYLLILCHPFSFSLIIPPSYFLTFLCSFYIVSPLFFYSRIQFFHPFLTPCLSCPPLHFSPSSLHSVSLWML